MQRVEEDEDNASVEDWLLSARFTYGRWDAEIEAYETASGDQFMNEEASALFLSPEGFDPERVKADLAKLTAPVLILAAEYDALPRPAVAALGAGCFSNARVVVQPRGGHFPWIDDADAFVRIVGGG